MQKRQEKIQEIGNSIAQAIYVHSHGNMPYEKKKRKRHLFDIFLNVVSFDRLISSSQRYPDNYPDPFPIFQ